MTAEPVVSPLFLAHGSPTLAIADIPAHRFLKELAKSLADPKAIVILSAHWETDGLKISAPGPLRTIHDFRGFPKALYDISYPAEASKDLVSRVTQTLSANGIDVTEDASWGLDHGSWVPLSLLYPNLSVPIVQLSLPHGSTPETVHALGRALSGLSAESILLAGSGSTTHNLRDIRAEGTPAPEWAQAFDKWIDEGLNRGDIAWFSNQDAAPDYRHAHPTDEHFLPLFFAMGAAGQDTPPELLHRSYSHGSISMSYFGFPAAKAA